MPFDYDLVPVEKLFIIHRTEGELYSCFSQSIFISVQIDNSN